MKKRTKISLIVGVAVVAIFGGVIGSLFMFSKPASAVTNNIAQKTVLYGLVQCYKDGAVTSDITGRDYDGPYSIMGYGSNSYILPTGVYDISYASCNELLNGAFDTNFPGALGMAGISAPADSSNTSAVSSFLTGLGYTETKGSGGQCASFTYQYEDDSSSTAVYKMCAATDSQGIITSDMMEVSGDTTAMSMKVSSGVVELYCNQLGRGGCSDHTFKVGDRFDEFAGEILGDLKEHNSSAVCLMWWCPWRLVESVQIEDSGSVLATYNNKANSTAINKMLRYLSENSYSSTASLSLSNDERISLLQDYLLNYYEVERYGGRCNLDESQQTIARGAGYDEISTSMFGDGLQTCWITPTKNKNSSVATYNGEGYVDGTTISYGDIVAELGGTVNSILDADKTTCNNAATAQLNEARAILDHSSNEDEIQRATTTISELNQIKREHGEYWHVDESGAIVCYPFTDINGNIVDTSTDSPSIPDNTPSGDPGEESKPTCFTDGSSLGWILCPALEAAGAATSGLYNMVIDQWLEIEAGEMTANDDNGVYSGWKAFRDMANIVFVILLIIVILSQVTGIGLTNYGIKKTLPTLIMVAVLVNLSFILCQVAVDVFNIVGDGIKAIFESLTVSGTGFGVDDFVNGLLVGLLGLGGIAGGVALTIAYTGSLEIILLPILLAVISALIGTLVFFLSLAIRKAGIFAMVILCPVAIVCYALPNTKKFFDRWLKLFTGLLLIYPVCGILMGGGKFFSAVLLTTSDGFLMSLTAMLVQVIPFFFIPTLVRGSLNMMGNIGTRLSNLGRRATGGLQGALRRSNWAQDRQQRIARDTSIRRNTRLANRGRAVQEALRAKQEANGGKLSSRDQRRLRRAEYETSRASDRVRRAANEDARAAAESRRALPLEGSMEYANMVSAYEDAAREKEINEYQAAMLNGRMSYGSGADEHEVDVNNLGKVDSNGNLQATPNSEKSLSAALLHYLDAYDNATDKNSASAQNALLRAQAIATRLLDAGGDNGQTIVTNALRGRSFDANGVVKNRDAMQATSRLSEYIARNGKWMGQIKKTDVGSFSFLNDAANKTADLKSRAEYHTMGDKKITAAAIPGLSDGFFEGLMQEIRTGDSGVFGDINGDAAQRLIDIDSAAQRALADERIANELKPETLDHLKAIHKKAYELQQQRWLQGSDSDGVANIEQLSGFNASGAEVHASGTNAQGYLLDQAGQILRAADGTQLRAADAYSNQIRRYVEYEAGKKPTSGEVKILHKKEMPQHWTYNSGEGKWKYIDIVGGINRDLTPEEVERAKMITQYNAEIEQQNAENNQR